MNFYMGRMSSGRGAGVCGMAENAGSVRTGSWWSLTFMHLDSDLHTIECPDIREYIDGDNEEYYEDILESLLSAFAQVAKDYRFNCVVGAIGNPEDSFISAICEDIGLTSTKSSDVPCAMAVATLANDTLCKKFAGWSNDVCLIAGRPDPQILTAAAVVGGEMYIHLYKYDLVIGWGPDLDVIGIWCSDEFSSRLLEFVVAALGKIKTK